MSNYMTKKIGIGSVHEAPADGTSYIRQDGNWVESVENTEIVNPFKKQSLSLKGQLHFHTTNSDGTATPVEMMEAYRDAGYDFASITDHNSITPDPGVTGITYIPGCEETHGRRHFVQIGATRTQLVTWPTGSSTLSETLHQQLIDQCSDDNTFTFLAHTDLPGLAYTDAELLGFNNHYGIEIYNGVGGVTNFERHVDLALSTSKDFIYTATDDAHDATTHIDKGWVVVNCNQNTPEAIIQALKEGNYYSSTGAEITDVLVNNKTVTVTVPVSSTIEFIGHVKVGENGGQIYQNSEGLTASYEVTGEELYLRVRVTAVGQAWSNPIKINPSGDKTNQGNFTRGTLSVQADPSKQLDGNIKIDGDYIYIPGGDLYELQPKLGDGIADRWRYVGNKSTNLSFNQHGAGYANIYLVNNGYYDNQTFRHTKADVPAADIAIRTGTSPTGICFQVRSTKSFSHDAESTGGLLNIGGCNHNGVWNFPAIQGRVTEPLLAEIGHKLSATVSATTLTESASIYDVATLTLPAGVWQVFGKVSVGTAGTTKAYQASTISLTSAAENNATYVNIAHNQNTVTTVDCSPLHVVVESGTLNVYLTARVGFTGTAPTTNAGVTVFYAVRIA